MDNIGNTMIWYFHNNQCTGHDMMVLFDSSIYSEKPSFYKYDEMSKLISHEKYVRHQHELERISKIEGAKSDSLLIEIFFLNDKKEQIRFTFNKGEQILEYTKTIRLLVGENEYLPVERYIKKNK
jgi:hypothetical protein